MDAATDATPRLVARVRRGVDGLAVRRRLGVDGAEAAACDLAVASSAHGGDVWDGELALLRAATGAVGARLAQRNSVAAVAWTGSDHVALGGDGGDVTVYAASRGGGAPAALAATLDFHDDAVSALGAVPGAPAQLVAASWDGS